MRLWVPSQKGLLTEPPQRQSAKFALPVRSYFWPSASTSSMEPSGASTRKGPFFLAIILTCAMFPPSGISTLDPIHATSKSRSLARTAARAGAGTALALAWDDSFLAPRKRRDHHGLFRLDKRRKAKHVNTRRQFCRSVRA